jgi:hypothetical protein
MHPKTNRGTTSVINSRIEYDHCLNTRLTKWKSGALPAEIVGEFLGQILLGSFNPLATPSVTDTKAL